ncbi:unnamed protein product (macronuclear) [Paramecium tetraurelia]|uniref:Uncharacterized protein n=1 Tax=Paramecium tetraurelia TaxID=5888 RepID=A0CGP2_PARTE|nr:uncharacterized protein GSPATT00007399001 [Paramecium tetraurelia]CAK69959.1 unnamed protein product [Paramecium tetraurelia]|eukprot:XP_001437356.1 hypothetical protein (macronuclear) [Paramecium tetraurelia strain d4-2]
MQKKTPLDRQQVFEMFVQPNYEFAQSVLQSHQFSFQHLPTVEEINTILNSVEKAYNSKRGTWTPCQDKFLNLLVLGTCLKYKEIPIELTSYQWEQISRMFRYHNWKACRNRWLEECHQKVSWTPAEDQVLIQLQQLHPNKWCEIAIEMMRICKTPYVRQGKQCRDRWVNKLDPNIVTLPWTKEEELKLFREIEKRGKRWAEISLKVFKLKRTENTIKNRYYNLLKQEENKIKLCRVTKDEKNEILVKSIIQQLEQSVNCKFPIKNEETVNQENQQYNFQLFDYNQIKKPFQLVCFVKRKIVKLNEI